MNNDFRTQTSSHLYKYTGHRSHPSSQSRLSTAASQHAAQRSRREDRGAKIAARKNNGEINTKGLQMIQTRETATNSKRYTHDNSLLRCEFVQLQADKLTTLVIQYGTPT